MRILSRSNWEESIKLPFRVQGKSSLGSAKTRKSGCRNCEPIWSPSDEGQCLVKEIVGECESLGLKRYWRGAKKNEQEDCTGRSGQLKVENDFSNSACDTLNLKPGKGVSRWVEKICPCTDSVNCSAWSGEVQRLFSDWIKYRHSRIRVMYWAEKVSWQ